MATPLDTLLIDEFTGGMNVPLLAQAGYPCQADGAGTNVEYVGPQVFTGTGVWNGKSRSILVRGSGARGVELGGAPYVGYEVRVIDADGTAGAGTITVAAGGATTLTGTATLTSNYQSRVYGYVAALTWALIG
jgi:hypothetical protein